MYKLIFKGNPVSINSTYRTNARGRGAKNIYLSQDAENYKNTIHWQAKKDWAKNPKLQGDLEVWVRYYFKDKRRRDHLNHNKLLFDGINQVVFDDDSQIKISHHYTLIDEVNPRIELDIEELTKD